MIPPRVAAFSARIGLTGIAIALLLALLAVQTVRIEGFKVWPLSIKGLRAEVSELREARRGCEARVSASNRSIETLQAAIEDQNLIAEQRAEAFAEAQELARRQDAENARKARATDERIARLQELARKPGQCAVSDELRELAEGL